MAHQHKRLFSAIHGLYDWCDGKTYERKIKVIKLELLVNNKR